jgi:hypothetical protein
MRHFTLPDGRVIGSGVAFEVNGLAFQPNYLDCADDAEIAAHGIVAAVAPVVTIDLVTAKARARTAINVAAENERLKYLTPGDGQFLTYSKKLDEARLILLDAAAADALDSAALKAAFPMIWASIPSDGATASAVAAVVQAKALQWAQIGAEIEKKRNTLLDAIDAAQTVEAVNAVVW